MKIEKTPFKNQYGTSLSQRITSDEPVVLCMIASEDDAYAGEEIIFVLDEKMELFQWDWNGRFHIYEGGVYRVKNGKVYHAETTCIYEME